MSVTCGSRISLLLRKQGIKAFHLDRRGERKDGRSLRSLADLEKRLQEK